MASPNAQHIYYQTIDFDENNRLNVVQHAHPNSVDVHLHLTSVTSSSTYVLIDISDTTNYAHNKTDFVHLENIFFDVDANNQADYEIALGYLTDVGPTAGTFVHLYSINGDKTAGKSRNVFVNPYPNGARMDNGYVTTNDRITSTIYATGNTFPSTIDSTTSNINPQTNDVILKITMNAGEIGLATNMSYHTH